MKNKRLFLVILLFSLTILLFSACGENGQNSTAPTTPHPSSQSTPTQGPTSPTTTSPTTTSPAVTGCSHNFEDVSGKASTCTEDGYTEHRVCKLCQEKEGYAIIPAAHLFEAIPGCDATCTENGYTEYRECSLCHEKDGYIVIEAGHNYVTIPEKTATDTETGYTEHQECTRCGHKEGYVVLESVHLHQLTEHDAGESDPMFYRCKCGFSVITELRSRPLIDQLSDRQYAEFLKIYNMIKNRESSCALNISEDEYRLFYDLIQGQCPELFLLEYQNASPTFYTNGAGTIIRGEWNPDCMSREEYVETCQIMIDTFLEWDKACQDLSDTEKVQYMVHWLVENTEFVTIGTHVRSLYGGIIEREIACVGYAQIMSWTMNNWGIPCMSVTGLAGEEGHMWNLIQLDDQWYQLDAGWNYANFHGTNYSNDVYVNVTDAELKIGTVRIYHPFFKNCGIEIPACTATTQNIARKNGTYVANSNDIASVFEAAIAQACQQKEYSFTLVCNDAATQNKISSYLQNAGHVLNPYGIKLYWYASGHDSRTNLYFVSVLLAEPNLEALQVTVAEPTTGTGYKLALRQNVNGQIIFFSGSMTGKYLSTVADPSRATDVFYKEVDGGFRLWFMDGYLKKYVDIVINDSGAVQTAITLTPNAVYRIDKATGAIIAKIDGQDYWLGTYNEYSTIGCSKISYISGSNASKIGVTQFPAQLVLVDGIAPSSMEEPPIPESSGTAYKLVMEQNNLGKTLYFQGTHSGNFLASTTNQDNSPNVYVEQVAGGYQLYYLWGENKMYLNVQSYSGRGISVMLKPTPGAVWTYNEDLGIYTVEMYGEVYYLGTYQSYNNFSLSKISFITGNNAGKIGVSQFPAYLVPVE